MKFVTIEISEVKMVETKQEHDRRFSNWLKEIRLQDHKDKSLAQIAKESGLTVDDVLRCESGEDIPLYESTKLLGYYDPCHCSCMIMHS